MDVQQVLHMNGGEGDASYAKNSQLQRKRINDLKPIVEEAMKRLCCAGIPQAFGIADLGCASGPNAYALVSMIIDAVQNECRLLGLTSPEFALHLNDLPGNDFNAVFNALPTFYDAPNERKADDGLAAQCFVYGVPGSFHGRLFPCNAMHVVCSCQSLHWLSRVPVEIGEEGGGLNKGNLCIGRTSSSLVVEAYKEQFRKDFTNFLESRSKEIVSGGAMILSLTGRATQDPTSEGRYNLWLPLQDALNDMVSEGLIEESKVDCFNLPYYAPHVEELRGVIQTQGSFHIARLDETIHSRPDNEAALVRHTKLMAKMTRAVSESLLANHFGQWVVEELFPDRFEKFLYKYVSASHARGVQLVISLVRRPIT